MARRTFARRTARAALACACLALAVFLAVAPGALLPRNAEAAQKRPFWWAPGRTWWARLLSDTHPELLVEMSRQPEVRSAGFKMWMKMVDEPGTWLTVSVQPVKVKSVVFTPRTKMVVTKKDGRVVESEGFFFWPDQLQTELYESAKRPVVVNMNAVYRGPRGFRPIGIVKFPAGSLRLGDVEKFEIVGAVEQSDDGERK